ncbi:MAG: sulfotransferase family protein, partial [Solirubrobacterales bacterium]
MRMSEGGAAEPDGDRGGDSLLGETGERLAWIFGSSRSGSTWLLRMLSQLKPVVPIDDPHIGHHLGVWRPIPLAWATAEDLPELRTLSDYKRDTRDYFFSDRYREAWEPALRELLRARFEAQAAEDAAARRIDHPLVVVKEPASHVSDILLGLFPGSRLIWLLRDGRDVVDSWLDAYREGTWATEGGAYPVSAEGRLAMVRWQSSVWLRRTEVMQRTFASLAPSNRLLVRYEDLREHSGRALERICRMLGIAGYRDRIYAVANANLYERVPVGERGEGREIRRAAPGGWRHSMSDEELAAMHAILAPKLAELGYIDRPPAPAGDP